MQVGSPGGGRPLPLSKGPPKVVPVHKHNGAAQVEAACAGTTGSNKAGSKAAAANPAKNQPIKPLKLSK